MRPARRSLRVGPASQRTAPARDGGVTANAVGSRAARPRSRRPHRPDLPELVAGAPAAAGDDLGRELAASTAPSIEPRNFCEVKSPASTKLSMATCDGRPAGHGAVHRAGHAHDRAHGAWPWSRRRRPRPGRAARVADRRGDDLLVGLGDPVHVGAGAGRARREDEREARAVLRVGVLSARRGHVGVDRERGGARTRARRPRRGASGRTRAARSSRGCPGARRAARRTASSTTLTARCFLNTSTGIAEVLVEAVDERAVAHAQARHAPRAVVDLDRGDGRVGGTSPPRASTHS